jgi:hypothetical protein
MGVLSGRGLAGLSESSLRSCARLTLRASEARTPVVALLVANRQRPHPEHYARYPRSSVRKAFGTARHALRLVISECGWMNHHH